MVVEDCIGGGSPNHHPRHRHRHPSWPFRERQLRRFHCSIYHHARLLEKPRARLVAHRRHSLANRDPHLASFKQVVMIPTFAPMPFFSRSSRQHQYDPFPLRGAAPKALAVVGMSLAFFASVVGLEYLLGDDRNLKSTAQSITESVWPWLRAAGFWGLSAILLIVSFIILMIKQMPDNRQSDGWSGSPPSKEGPRHFRKPG